MDDSNDHVLSVWDWQREERLADVKVSPQPHVGLCSFPFGAFSSRWLPVRLLLLTRFMAPSPTQPSGSPRLNCSPLGPTPAPPPPQEASPNPDRVSLSFHNIYEGFSFLILRPRPFKFNPLCIRSLFLSFDKCHVSPVASRVEEAPAGGNTEMCSPPARGGPGRGQGGTAGTELVRTEHPRERGARAPASIR